MKAWQSIGNEVEWKTAADVVMIKAGMDDTKTFAIYRPQDASGEDAGLLFLKTQPNTYAGLKAK